MKPRIAVLLVLLILPVLARGQGQRAPQAPPTPRATAPIDLTGYWVSLVTNEWRWRMLTPVKGDYAVLPINAAARKIADSWDPARDEANGEQCKSYGAAAIMHVPGRLRFSWEGDDVLRVDTDAGSQTRMFRFGASVPPQNAESTWQGHSAAEWQVARGRGREAKVSSAATGSLKVVTTRLRPGYLRKNGVPYSANTVVTEYFTRIVDAKGTPYLNVTVIVEDPQYLTGPYVRSMQFRREPDGSKFKPQPCSAR